MKIFFILFIRTDNFAEAVTESLRQQNSSAPLTYGLAGEADKQRLLNVMDYQTMKRDIIVNRNCCTCKLTDSQSEFVTCLGAWKPIKDGNKNVNYSNARDLIAFLRAPLVYGDAVDNDNHLVALIKSKQYITHDILFERM